MKDEVEVRIEIAEAVVPMTDKVLETVFIVLIADRLGA